MSKAKLTRGAALLAGALGGNGSTVSRIGAGLSGLGLLHEAMKQGTPSEGREIEVRTIRDRLAIIAANIHTGRRTPRLVRLTRRLVSMRCDGDWCIEPRDEVAMIELLHVAVRDGIRWVKDPVGIDCYANPMRTIEDKAGDCAQKVGALGAMLAAVGIPCNVVAGEEVGAGDYNHAWLEALPEGLPPIPCDPTFDKTVFWRFDDTAEAAPAGWSIPSAHLVRTYTLPVWR